MLIKFLSYYLCLSLISYLFKRNRNYKNNINVLVQIIECYIFFSQLVNHHLIQSISIINIVKELIIFILAVTYFYILFFEYSFKFTQ